MARPFKLSLLSVRSLGAIALLTPLTLWGATHYFAWTMMGLTTFCLAYSGKGLRRTQRRVNLPNPGPSVPGGGGVRPGGR